MQTKLLTPLSAKTLQKQPAALKPVKSAPSQDKSSEQASKSADQSYLLAVYRQCELSREEISQIEASLDSTNEKVIASINLLKNKQKHQEIIYQLMDKYGINRSIKGTLLEQIEFLIEQIVESDDEFGDSKRQLDILNLFQKYVTDVETENGVKFDVLKIEKIFQKVCARLSCKRLEDVK
ncbi:Hypothetical_protein [Hexamita inflata]|uniref:Hypothetical_protein n=1 Tax=Hexamita inflata TaxID=28002 RepID=A0AA86UC66_9EUKA|nr:Hypothetical protein HINF_LOCUS24033 [Hexamita inflata]